MKATPYGRLPFPIPNKGIHLGPEAKHENQQPGCNSFSNAIARPIRENPEIQIAFVPRSRLKRLPAGGWVGWRQCAMVWLL